jgi:glucose-6-phosphate isomerase
MSYANQTTAWQALEKHFHSVRDLHMRELFEQDAARFDSFSLKINDILFDFSKNRVTGQTLELLMALARESDVEGWRERMFSGEEINHTEQRAVLHVALRNQSARPMMVRGVDVMAEVREELQRVKELAERIRSRQWRGATGQPITDVVNIGIGGSHLGPQMATEALYPYTLHDLHIHYLNNIDENHIIKVLEKLNPETTLFIVASKSFTTQEAMVNAETARKWLLDSIVDESLLGLHMVAVTSNVAAAVRMGIKKENIFKMWDWVGGRYSMWSAIGLPIVIAIGPDNFEALLQGAFEVDEHFRTAPLEQNIPVVMAMLGVWYNNFFGAESMAILPYDQNMHRFPAYMQQADMESNGKASIRNFQGIARHHRALMSNVFAQTEALMKGRNEDEVVAELRAEGKNEAQIKELLPYKIFEGNRPTNTFLFGTLDPKTLGSLIALYEHKIFVQGVIWNLNSFDQWGVELGKKMATSILSELNANDPVTAHDASTNGLINYYLQQRNLNS